MTLHSMIQGIGSEDQTSQKTMTIQEKYSMVQGIGFEDQTSPSRGYYLGNIPPIPRLSIPSLNLQDGPQGFRTSEDVLVDQVTAWPCSLGVASTWDEKLARKWGSAMGHEFKEKGANVILGPSVDVLRVARFGRMAESLSGEDPILGGRLGVNYVKSVQEKGVIATAKHLSAYHQETNRETYDALVDKKILFELYYRPFRALIEEGELGAIMCSYNKVNGEHSCQNKQMLKRDLKNGLGFGGFVMSDWWSIRGVEAAVSGLDMEQPGNYPYTEHKGHYFNPDSLSLQIDDAIINDMVYRILNSMSRIGVFESSSCSPPNCDHLLLKKVVTSQEHQKLARQIAGESIALLKNEGSLLPLNHTKRLKLAVIGSACDPDNPTKGFFWDKGSYFAVGGSGRVLSTRSVSFLRGLLAQKKDPASRFDVVADLSDDVESSLVTMEEADVSFVCAGTTSGETKDRENLEFDQTPFVTELTRRAKGSIVGVLISPGPVTVPFANEMDAIINLFLGGEATGYAFSDVIFGFVNPSGRLPVTFPKTEEGTIPPCLFNICSYNEGLMTGYRGMSPEQIEFPFGHGLSYSKFSHYRGSKTCVPTPEEAACFYIGIRNTSPRDGADVVQLYVQYPEIYKQPPKTLKDFRKVFIKSEKTETVRLAIQRKDLEIWAEPSGWVLPFGKFRAFIGSSSLVFDIQENFEVKNF